MVAMIMIGYRLEVRIGITIAAHALLLGEQGHAVGDGDLIVVRVDFAKGQETVAVAAEIHEGGLKGRLYPRDFREVDVALQLFLR